MTPAFTLGDMLRQLREERGLTQVQLARRLGLTGNGFVSRLESGAALPSPRLRTRLARELGVEPALLESRARRERQGSTATALLAELGAAFDTARAQLDAELAELRQSLAQHQARLAHTLRLSELQLVWGLPDKLAYEATARAVWVLTPDLLLDTQNAALRGVIAANLARGVEYRYLVPDHPGVAKRARRFLERLPAQARASVRAAAPDPLVFLSEWVLYDADTPQRLGLVIAPTARSDVDCVLSPAHAAGLARGFREAWAKARPVSVSPRTPRR